jgi:hypothetical protein
MIVQYCTAVLLCGQGQEIKRKVQEKKMIWMKICKNWQPSMAYFITVENQLFCH